MSWLYEIFSVHTFSALLGVFEMAAAVLLAVKPWWPRVSVGGSLLAIMLFASTISFMFTTPGVFEASQGGFPALSLTGGFLMKDIALLGISVWTLADAVRALRQRVDPERSSAHGQVRGEQVAVTKARKLIDAKQYVLDSDWGDVQPNADAQNAFLENHTGTNTRSGTSASPKGPTTTPRPAMRSSTAICAGSTAPA